MRNWLIALLFTASIIVPRILHAQITQIPDNQCVYRLGDNPAWAAANLDTSGWQPYTSYKMTGEGVVLWIRCTANLESKSVEQPALAVGSDTSIQEQVFMDGNRLSKNDTYRIFRITPSPSSSTHILLALRVALEPIIP